MTLDDLLKSTARSLYLSAKILPCDIRPAFYCGYLICRAADTVADTDLIPADKRLQLIKNYPRMTETQDTALLAAFRAAIPADIKIHPAEQMLLNNLDICLKAFNALSAAHKQMVLEVAAAVCRAMEGDISYFPAQDSGLIKALPGEAQTIEYCNDMGGKPGIFWAKLLLAGKQDDDFINNARNIGRALQITNILRDMAADTAIARCYLPLTDLAAHNLMPQDLLDKKNYKKLRPVINKWINWGALNLSSAPDFLAKIPRYKLGARAAVAWPVLWSLDTFYMLAASENLLDKTQHVKIPKKTIYLTMLLSPFFCCSNFIFKQLVNRKIKQLKKVI